jgi:hypothetical protein
MPNADQSMATEGYADGHYPVSAQHWSSSSGLTSDAQFNADPGFDLLSTTNFDLIDPFAFVSNDMYSQWKQYSYLTEDTN